MKKNVISLRNILLYLLTFIFIVFSISSYTEYGSEMKILKNICQILIIIIALFKVKLKKFKWTIPIILVLIVYPLILITFGIYKFYPLQVLMYLGMVLINILFYIVLSDFYFDKFDTFIYIWQLSSLVTLLVLLIIYRGISLNIPYMLKAVITNERYGSSLIVQRYGMGFNNVNQLALFSSILMVCSIYFIYKKKRIIFSIVCSILSFIFICNSESRAPFVALGLSIIVLIIINMKSIKLKKILLNTIYLSILLFSIYFAYYAFNGATLSSTYQNLNNISSMRLYFSSQALSFARSIGTKWFGVGPMSTSFVTHEVFGSTLTLDNSLGYCLFSYGIVGTIIIVMILVYFIRSIYSNNNVNYFIIYFITYAIFENALFIPNSLLSCFGCVIIFILMRIKNEKKCVSDCIDNNV